MIDTKTIRGVCGFMGPNTVLKLCDEIDRLQEREDDRSAWGIGPVRLREAEEEINQLQDEVKDLKCLNSNQFDLVHEKMEEIEQLKAEVTHLNGINKKNSDYNFNVRKAQKEEIADLKREITELMFLKLPDQFTLIDKQEKEIQQLKADLASARNVNAWHQNLVKDLHKEIVELKTGFNRQLSSADYTARVELTKAIQKTLKEHYSGVAFVLARGLNDAVNKWGVKE